MKSRICLSLMLVSGMLFPGMAMAKETIYYFHNDHLGTPQAMSDQSGTIVWKAEYEPFGTAVVDEDPDGDGIAVTCNLRFPGQYFDAESGLHYNYHRDYDPSTGRYLEADPIGIVGRDGSPYAYVSSNPVLSQDPFGLIEWTGTQTGGGFLTAGFHRYLLKSECVKSRECHVEVWATGVGASLGATETWLVSFTKSSLTFLDLTDYPSPNVFNGRFLMAYLGVAFGKSKWNVGDWAIQLGSAKSFGFNGTNSGFDASFGVLLGTSTVVDYHFECCRGGVYY